MTPEELLLGLHLAVISHWGEIRCTLLRTLFAPLAQSVERFHGKEKVTGSIPVGGSAG